MEVGGVEREREGEMERKGENLFVLASVYVRMALDLERQWEWKFGRLKVTRGWFGGFSRSIGKTVSPIYASVVDVFPYENVHLIVVPIH